MIHNRDHTIEGVEEEPEEGGDPLGHTKELWKVGCKSTLPFSVLYFVDTFVGVKY